MKKIKNTIDKYFSFMESRGGNFFVSELVPKQMVDHSIPPKFEGYPAWKAIPSIVSSTEILELEEYYGHPLPVSYKDFLKYRHFIELELGQEGIRFFKNLPNSLVQDTKEEIENFYWNLINRNYLPFAAQSDYGVLCFDANKSNSDSNYPVFFFDRVGIRVKSTSIEK